MRRTAITLLTSLLAVALGGQALAAKLEDVLAKHVDARGGQRWREIGSMTITGSYTAFSETEPFTLKLAPGHRYHLDVSLAGARRRVGFDGETAWTGDEDGARELDPVDTAILLRESDFPTPFFGYPDNGYEIELLGDTELDGRKAIGLSVKRGDGFAETWYLDPKTYLEIGRVSPGNDWMGQVERRTFYEDFREVDGVVVPFHVESEWSTRHRVMELASVETGAAIDDALFRIPPSPGMEPLQPLAGTWVVRVAQRPSPDAEWQESERGSTIALRMAGGMLEEKFSTDGGVDVVRTFSYDRFNETYRVTQIDSRRRQLNVQEGRIDDDGRLVVSNLETGTGWTRGETRIHGRASFFEITDDGFKVDYEVSTDGGESWFLAATAVYARPAPGEEGTK